jgi:hypothetical protein
LIDSTWPKCVAWNRVKDHGGFELFETETEEDLIYSFNVTEAHSIIQARHPPDNSKTGEVPPEMLERFRYVNTFVEQHLAHVTSEDPGVIATFFDNSHLRIFLIDGNHRVENVIRAGKKPTFFVLTPDETSRCFLGTRAGTPTVR